MPDKYKNRYRIASARLQQWDYGSDAAYFVTICTKDRECFFGNVVDEKMELSAIGEIVKREWLKSFEMRPDMNLEMGEFQIMPNHFHGIVIIGENEYNRGGGDVLHCPGRDAMHCVSTPEPTDPTNAPNDAPSPKNKFGPQSKNLASIIRGFKIGVTTNARLILPEFGWQSRFHDHIIRDQKSFDNISNYIINNPSNWRDDKFYQKP